MKIAHSFHTFEVLVLEVMVMVITYESMESTTGQQIKQRNSNVKSSTKSIK